MNEVLNRHNNVMWSFVNPHYTIEVQEKSVGLTVWAAISSFGKIGPYFFHKPIIVRGQLTTSPEFNPCAVNGSNYLEM